MIDKDLASRLRRAVVEKDIPLLQLSQIVHLNEGHVKAILEGIADVDLDIWKSISKAIASLSAENNQSKDVYKLTQLFQSGFAFVQDLILRDRPGETYKGENEGHYCDTCDALLPVGGPFNFCPWCGKRLDYRDWS